MLVIEAEWVGQTYEAAVDGVAPEWPPHPARLFCALVAVHDRVAGGAESLRWLEHERPPEVRCSSAELADRAAYVVTNAVSAKPTHPFHLGRVAAGQQRRWPRAAPRLPRVQFVWAESEPDGEQRVRIEALCRRVPYLGRATSPACLRVVPTPDDGLEHRWVPERRGSVRLGVPYGGYLDVLSEAFDAGRQHHDIRRRIGYERVDRIDLVERVAPSAFAELFTVRFRAEQGRLDGSHTARLTGYLRNAVRSRGADLPCVHGHGNGPRVAFVTLPFVGREHADGSVGAVGLALEPGIEPTDRLAVLRALFGSDREPPLEEITCGPLGVVRLDRRRPSDWSSSPERWSRANTTWVTATPLVLDRFPKRPGDLDREVLASFERSGFPRPSSIEISTAPLTEGGVQLSPVQAVRRNTGRPARPLPFRHVRARFDVPVSGPMIVGSMRYFGLGLMLPEPGQSETGAE